MSTPKNGHNDHKGHDDWGTPIPRERAQAYLEKYELLKKAETFNADEKDFEQEANGENLTFYEQVRNFSKSRFNAFVFNKKAVERFFDGGAEFLMVVLGAKLDTGKPTIVLVGCNKNQNGSFESLPGSMPGTEQPPPHNIAIIPPAPSGKDDDCEEDEQEKKKKRRRSSAELESQNE